jgi:saccharopine dehydrogenase-like NADP-dependent oxidoreductase
MTQRIFIVGGTGKIGLAVACDLLSHTRAELILTGRNRAKGKAIAAALPDRCRFLPLDLATATVDELAGLLDGVDLAIQCAGPFRTLPPALLAACIVAGVDYIDVCDDRRATAWRLGLHNAARSAGITALIDIGTFPGIDNVMVAHLLAQRPQVEDIRLYFACAGSGAGGYGVLETMFLAVSSAYDQLENGCWRQTPSFGARQVVDFGAPLGRRPVYNFDVPELWSLPRTYPQLRHCTSKFGTVPELWNWATVAVAHLPESVRRDAEFIHDSITFTLPWVHRLDRLTGVAVGIRVEARGETGRDEAMYFYAPTTSEAVGWATGVAACMMLDGTINAPGVHLPETHVPPAPYFAALTARGARFDQMPL